jgi:hypothetical protein
MWQYTAAEHIPIPSFGTPLRPFLQSSLAVENWESGHIFSGRNIWFGQTALLALSFAHLQSGSFIQSVGSRARGCRLHGEVNEAAGARRAA